MQTQVEDSDLIELIYASLLGESSWQDFLDRLTLMAPGCWSVLHANDLGNGEASVGLVSGRSVGDVADYATYYHHISPWVKYCKTDPTGEANVVERNVPGHMLERSEFYTDFLRPIETRSAIGVGVDREGERSLIVSLMTPDAVEEELLPLAQRLTRIAPHLMRAGEFYRRTSFAAQTTELGATFFDALHMGMVVVGNGRRIRMEGERERSIFEGPGVCLTMEPMTGAGRFFDLDQFSRSYGLTGAEVRALTGLIAGRSVEEIAREAGRSRETIRTQVKSLYAKTGARGEADLLRLVSGMNC